ncbi:ATP-binding cassette transporter [Clonorchis sinensis]|uniref:ATP-binding cassette transporter n=1 Tax=Clonorchis sinensis TaxID=79923 RepID=G7Y8B1_CLOSI|nr:ATP-binding cassette transporter [Clonorchis sinensis]
MPIHYLRRSTIAQQYRSELAQQLSTCTGSANVDEAWQNVKGAMLATFSAVCPTSPIRPQDYWMSVRSLSKIDARKSIPAGNEYDGARKSLKRQIVKSLRKDREFWRKSKAREMEKAFATGNSRALYQLIRSTGPRKATVSETISEKHGSLIHSRKRRLERWAEHFEEHFS